MKLFNQIMNVAATICLSTAGVTATAQNVPQLRADNIDEVIKAMTLEEKAQLLVGGGNDGFVGSGAMPLPSGKTCCRSCRHNSRYSTFGNTGNSSCRRSCRSAYRRSPQRH